MYLRNFGFRPLFQQRSHDHIKFPFPSPKTVSSVCMCKLLVAFSKNGPICPSNHVFNLNKGPMYAFTSFFRFQEELHNFACNKFSPLLQRDPIAQLNMRFRVQKSLIDLPATGFSPLVPKKVPSHVSLIFPVPKNGPIV